VRVINAHAYATAGRTELRAIARESQRPLVMSEVDGDGSTPHNHTAFAPALALAGQIIDDMRDLRPRQWTFWQAVEDESGMVAANGNWGLIHADLLGDTHVSVTTKKYHAMAQFTKFIRSGAVWAACNDANTVAMIAPARSTLVIVTRNAGPAEEPVLYDLSRSFGAPPGWRPTAPRGPRTSPICRPGDPQDGRSPCRGGRIDHNLRRDSPHGARTTRP
jgi:hypothetical protein